MNSSDRQYRRMNIDDDSYSSNLGKVNHADEMEEMQRKLEDLRTQQEQIDQFKQRMVEAERKKAEFIQDQIDLAERMDVDVEKITAEIESMRNEVAVLEQIRTGFKKNLAVLASINANSWPADTLEQQLDRAVEVLDSCKEEYNDAVEFCMQLNHTKVLGRVRRRKSGMWIGMKEVWYQFQQGFAFHLPLVVLLTIIYLIVSCYQHPT